MVRNISSDPSKMIFWSILRKYCSDNEVMYRYFVQCLPLEFMSYSFDSRPEEMTLSMTFDQKVTLSTVLCKKFEIKYWTKFFFCFIYRAKHLSMT